MRNQTLDRMKTVAIVGAILWLVQASAAGQAPTTAAPCPQDSAQFRSCAIEKAKTFNPSRTADGKPDLQGFWNQYTSNVEEHPADSPRGTPGADAGGKTLIVEPADGKVPYQPWAVVQRKQNAEHYIPPMVQCYPPGVPRQVYIPGGIQILQPPDSGYVIVLAEETHGYRIIPTDGRPHIGTNVRLWQGDSRGRWEGNTLVVDVTNSNARPWIDRSGNFFSDTAHVIERFTLVAADTIYYEATIQDPRVFTRPWTMSFPLTRRREQGYEFLEDPCHEGDHSVPHLRELGFTPYPGVVPPQ